MRISQKRQLTAVFVSGKRYALTDKGKLQEPLTGVNGSHRQSLIESSATSKRKPAPVLHPHATFLRAEVINRIFTMVEFPVLDQAFEIPPIELTLESGAFKPFSADGGLCGEFPFGIRPDDLNDQGGFAINLP
jgi:hypothetical protein